MSTVTFLLSPELRRMQWDALNDQRDASETSIAAYDGSTGVLPTSPAPVEPTHMVTVLPSGAWLVSLGCERCGAMCGFSAPRESAQAAIHDWQNGHVIECRGGQF